MAKSPNSPPLTEERDLVRQLRLLLADLESYTQRRAQRLAAPMVERIRADAAEAVAAARSEVVRQQNLIRELRRALAVRDRQPGQGAEGCGTRDGAA